MKTIAFIIGTRPEAIKLAPLYLEMQKRSCFTPFVWLTGQHGEMVYQPLRAFGVTWDAKFNLSSSESTGEPRISAILAPLERALFQKTPDAIVVQGDTASALAGAYAGFLKSVPVLHIEAGLRSFVKVSPFPEEMNRCLIGQIADYHFAPTEEAKQNLIREHISPLRIWLTGNTGIDALKIMLERIHPSLSEENAPKRILITTHRRESFGEPLENICKAVSLLAEKYPDVEFVYSLHANPHANNIAMSALWHLRNVKLFDSIGYDSFVALLNDSYFVMTDSGGIQEEAAYLGKPVLVMREETERSGPECLKLIGRDTDRIVTEASALIEFPLYHEACAKSSLHFGDGTASKRIADVCEEVFCK